MRSGTELGQFLRVFLPTLTTHVKDGHAKKKKKNSAGQIFPGSRIGMTNVRDLSKKPSEYEHQLLTSKRRTSNFSLHTKCQSLGVPKQKFCGQAEPIAEQKRTCICVSEKLKKVNQF